MKEILFYIPSFQRGGAERVASVLLNHWHHEKKLQLQVVNTIPEENDWFQIAPGIKREFLNYDYNATGIKALLERIRRFFLLRRYLKNNKHKLVISFLSFPSILLLLSSIGLRNKVICCEHNNYYAVGNITKRWFKNLLYFMVADKVTLLTERDISNYPFWLRNKFNVLPNPLGVDGRLYNRTEKKAGNTINLLFVGRLTQQKGIDRLCHIIGKIKHKNWQLDVCGDGELRADLKKFILEKNLLKRVYLHGNVTNIEDFYKNADLLMMTSYWEGLPMVIAEAMSFGLPVIAFDCPTGPREFIDNKANGILVDDGDIERYFNALNQTMLDHKSLVKMSVNAKETSEKYTMDKIDKLWEELLLPYLSDSLSFNRLFRREIHLSGRKSHRDDES